MSSRKELEETANSYGTLTIRDFENAMKVYLLPLCKNGDWRNATFALTGWLRRMKDDYYTYWKSYH